MSEAFKEAMKSNIIREPIPYKEKHIEDFRKSGLTLDTVKKAGYESVNDSWIVPITNPLTKETYYHRKKLDKPIKDKEDKKKEIRYLSLPGSIPHLYFSLQLDWNDVFKDCKTIVLTEGEKKADKYIQDTGKPAVAVSGVWCWSSEGNPIDDLKMLCEKVKIVLIAFDSDYKDKPQVQKAKEELIKAIESFGCIAVDCSLPGPEKGLDDFLVAKGITELEKHFTECNKLKAEQIKYEKAVEESAIKMLKSPNFVDNYLKECELFGLIGETNNKVQVYLENCSRLSKEINGGISSKGQAPTAVGKTTLYKIIGKNFFSDDFIIRTDRSAKVMLWKERDEWKYKIILTEENHTTKVTPETEAKDYQMRIAKSEGILTYEVLVKDDKKGFISKKTELEGPFVFQEATTKLDFKDEDINRDMVHNFDESVAQTTNIIELQKSEAGSYNPKLDRLKKFIVDKHKKIQEILKNNIPDVVVIPFVKKIKYPRHLIRARRDFPRLLRYIEVSAFIHQFQREILTEEEYAKKYLSHVDDCGGLLIDGVSTAKLSIDATLEALLTDVDNSMPSASNGKRILIADEKDFEFVEKYVISDFAKEYIQLPKVIEDRYNLLYEKYGTNKEFKSIEAGEVLGVSDDCTRKILYSLEKKELCSINRNVKPYKYRLNAKALTTRDFGLIALDQDPQVSTEPDSVNNSLETAPILDSVVDTTLINNNQQGQQQSIQTEPLPRNSSKLAEKYIDDEPTAFNNGIEEVTDNNSPFDTKHTDGLEPTEELGNQDKLENDPIERYI